MFEKFLPLLPLTASGLSGAMTTCIAISTWVAIPFIEKAGQRKWLITSSCLQTTSLAVLTGLSSHPSYGNSAPAAAFMFAFAVVLGATWALSSVSCPCRLLSYPHLSHSIVVLWEVVAFLKLLTGKSHFMQIVYVSDLRLFAFVPRASAFPPRCFFPL